MIQHRSIYSIFEKLLYFQIFSIFLTFFLHNSTQLFFLQNSKIAIPSMTLTPKFRKSIFFVKFKKKIYHTFENSVFFENCKKYRENVNGINRVKFSTALFVENLKLNIFLSFLKKNFLQFFTKKYILFLPSSMTLTIQFSGFYYL